ncbi:MAG: sigma-54-dependent Fis family transcriptional regulator [Deltaproteobacteria bacterium]|nr:sigma-54-dependent Fis family transcriptional regulator [Deltaproteobacteria bacterium]
MSDGLGASPRRAAGASGVVVLVGDGASASPWGEMAADAGAWRVVRARDAETAFESLDPDVLVVVGANGGSAACLREATALCPDAVRILVTEGDGDAVAAAYASVAVPRAAGPEALRAVCELALRSAFAERNAHDLATENQRLRGIDVEAVRTLDGLEGIERYEGLLTRSPAMREVLALLEKIEDNETSVLIHGETGTGKELVAQAIHARSRRRKGRFVAVNLGAISDQLRESELFGHVRGAFTGATESRAGLFAEADGGCIFLDEIGDASPALQVALLRVLEEGTILPVGSDRPRNVDVRIISATNRDLATLVREGLFRRDLFYRLNVFPIELPPLSKRPEDIFTLANHFLARASLDMGKKPLGISREARAVLEAYHWEGNVRELRNVMERAAILCKGGLVIAADLPVGERANGAAPGAQHGIANIAIPPGGATLQDLEREIFTKTLAITRGNQRRAARVLGLRESTFRFRMRKLGVGTAASAAPLCALVWSQLDAWRAASGALIG